MLPPMGSPLKSKLMSMYLPNLQSKTPFILLPLFSLNTSDKLTFKRQPSILLPLLSLRYYFLLFRISLTVLTFEILLTVTLFFGINEVLIRCYSKLI